MREPFVSCVIFNVRFYFPPSPFAHLLLLGAFFTKEGILSVTFIPSISLDVSLLYFISVSFLRVVQFFHLLFCHFPFFNSVSVFLFLFFGFLIVISFILFFPELLLNNFNFLGNAGLIILIILFAFLLLFLPRLLNQILLDTVFSILFVLALILLLALCRILETPHPFLPMLLLALQPLPSLLVHQCIFILNVNFCIEAAIGLDECCFEQLFQELVYLQQRES